MRIVSNTSPLVFLAKLGKLEFLDKHELLVPQQVVEELHIWEKSGKGAYVRLMGWFANANVAVKKTYILPKLPKILHEGEKAAISLAINEKVKTVLMDERRARIAAEALGLKAIGTMAVIKQQLKEKRITVKECRQTVFELIKNGYRIKEELLAEFLLNIEKPEDKK
ncbi:hypothetical protein HYY73_04310 [Candidatus Woesearchaeota archaeon]|nr:hypothetical protein [Candidatus Woesearchaeota archaeon]